MPLQVTLPDGRQVFAEPQGFVNVGGEPWSEYRLDDGTRVKVKVVVQKIFRILKADGTPEVTPDGDPHVMVRSVTHVTTEVE